MKQLIAKFIADEQGQDIIEYALIGSFVSLGSYLGASALRTSATAVPMAGLPGRRQGRSPDDADH